MIFYLILLTTVCFSFSFFFYLFYQIEELSTPYKSINYVIGMMIGVGDKTSNMFDKDETFTFIIFALFYFLMISIMLNMIYVFVVYEFNEYEQTLEVLTYLYLLNQEKKSVLRNKNAEVINVIHPYTYAY